MLLHQGAGTCDQIVMTTGYRSVFLILLRFRLHSFVFVTLWRVRFWCETGAVQNGYPES